MYNRLGRVVNIGDLYLFQPIELDNKNSVIFNNKLHSLIVFNSPHILSSLNSFFSSYVTNDVINKVTLVSKKDTEDRVDKLINKINNLNI